MSEHTCPLCGAKDGSVPTNYILFKGKRNLIIFAVVLGLLLLMAWA